MRKINQRWLNWRMLVIDDRRLSFGEKGMALYLSTFMNARQDFAFPAITTICGEMSVARATAVKYIRGLEGAGWLMKEKRYGRSTIYHAATPDNLLSSSNSDSSSNSELVEDLDHSSSQIELSVVQDLNPNSQLNSQKNKQGTRLSKFDIPTVEDVREYCEARCNVVDPHAFLDFYESKGWMVGKNKMKCWKSAVRTWERRSNGGNGGQSEGYGVGGI